MVGDGEDVKLCGIPDVVGTVDLVVMWFLCVVLEGSQGF